MPILTLGEDTFDPNAERTEYVPIPVDEFVDLRVDDVQQRVLPWKDENGNDIPRMEFQFTIEGPAQYQGRKIKGETPTTFTANENCKLRNWTQEILGVELAPGFQLNTDHLIGKSVRGIVDQRVQKKEKVEEGQEPKVWNYVRDVIRTKESFSVPDEPF